TLAGNQHDVCFSIASGSDWPATLEPALSYSVPMTPIQPDQAHFLLQGVYLPGLRNEHRITKSIIEAIPLSKGDYSPDAISKTALELAWHIAATEMRFMDAVLAGQFDLSPRPRPDSIKNSEDLAGCYAENFDLSLEKLAKLSDEQLLKIIDFRGM